MAEMFLDDFRRVAEEIAEDLEMEEGKIKIGHGESHLGFDYTAGLFNNTRGFDFHLRKKIEKTRQKTIEKMEASLAIHFQEGVAPYFFHESIDYIVGHPDFLGRWASWAIFNFRQAHEKINLESLFHEMDIRIYGIPGYCEPAESEAETLFNGILATQEGKVIVYRFRHMDPESYLCRSLSYAVYVSPKGFSSFWAVFPDNCGLDSGGGYSAYNHFEKLIEKVKQRYEVEVKKYDALYDEFEAFLLKKSAGFSSAIGNHDLDMLTHHSNRLKVLDGSQKEFEGFMQRLEKKQYSQALRDLRALVQQAQENVVRSVSLDASHISDPDVNKLASLLIEHKYIDGRLRSWFTAFTSIANLASHGDFPTKKNMTDPLLRTRVLLTFHIGIYLIDELNQIVTPKIPLFDVSHWQTDRKYH